MLTCFAAIVLTPVSICQPPADEATTWICQNSMKPITCVAGSGFDDLAGLDSIIGNARVVSLGEPTHGTREAFQMKHRLLEYLVEKKGFSIFSIEASMPESYRLNDYVIRGEGDPKQLIAGMYFWTWNTQEVFDMVEWMRAWNQNNPPETGKPRLQFTGFDMQTPDVAWSIAGEFINAYAPDLTELHKPLLKEVHSLAASASLGAVTPGWTTMTGTFPVEPAQGKQLRFSAYIKTKGVSGWAGAWWRCDTPKGVNGFNNMSDKQIKGDTDWTRHEFTIDIPKDTNNINFGFMLSGDGVVWFDDVKVELDGVVYENPSKFSFDFENNDVKFLDGGSAEYKIGRVEAEAHSGKKSLEIRRRPESEVPKVDRAEVRRHAKALYESLLSRRDDLIAKTDAQRTDWAIQNAKVVWQCARMYADAGGYNVRDACMADNVQWILDQNPGQKIVLWAHNGHASRTTAFGMVSMGSHLAKALEKQMVVFGFITGNGKYTAMKQGKGLLRDNELQPAADDSIEAIFEHAGLPIAILDLRSASDSAGGRWATSQKKMRSIGAMAMADQFYDCVAADSYDVLLWQERTTASKAIE